MAEDSDTKGSKTGVRRVATRLIAALGALGVLSALGGGLVNAYLPGLIVWAKHASPLSVTVGYNDTAYDDGFSVVVPHSQGLAQRFRGVHGDSACVQLLRTARAAGAEDGNATFLQVVLQGRDVAQSTITGMRVRILARGEPTRSALVSCPSAGGIANIPVYFDLDSENPIALAMSNNGTPTKRPYFGPNGAVISVGKDEVVPLSIEAATTRHSVAWEVVLDVLHDGHRTTLTIDNDGQPFRTTALLHPSRYHVQYEWAWWLKSPRLKVTT